MELLDITPSIVKSLLADKELFDRVSEDGVDYESYIPPIDKRHLGIFKDHTLMGFVTVYSDNSTTFNIHFHVLKQFRVHSIEIGNVFLEFMFSKYESIEKLNAKIPETYPDVCTYIKKFGFKQEGIDRKSVKKSGELVDRYLFGLTRGEHNGRS